MTAMASTARRAANLVVFDMEAMMALRCCMTKVVRADCVLCTGDSTRRDAAFWSVQALMLYMACLVLLLIQLTIDQGRGVT